MVTAYLPELLEHLLELGSSQRSQVTGPQLHSRQMLSRAGTRAQDSQGRAMCSGDGGCSARMGSFPGVGGDVSWVVFPFVTLGPELGVSERRDYLELS